MTTEQLEQLKKLYASMELLERRLVARIEQQIHDELISYALEARHVNG